MSSTKLSKPSPSISLNHININKYNLHLRWIIKYDIFNIEI